MKKIVGGAMLISYPKFIEIFIIHTEASKMQFGRVIIQDGKTIAFYSRKLTLSQINYRTTELELLSIVETLEYFCEIILVNLITVYTYHNNITYEKFTT